MTMILIRDSQTSFHLRETTQRWGSLETRVHYGAKQARVLHVVESEVSLYLQNNFLVGKKYSSKESQRFTHYIHTHPELTFWTGFELPTCESFDFSNAEIIFKRLIDEDAEYLTPLSEAIDAAKSELGWEFRTQQD